MQGGDLQRIHKMKKYCTKIAESIDRYGHSLETFSDDWDYHSSVSMSIMQIGELTNGLSDEFKEQYGQQIPWELIRGMRNRFAHGYAEMEDTVIWQTATKHIPELLDFCGSIIGEAGGTS